MQTVHARSLIRALADRGCPPNYLFCVGSDLLEPMRIESGYYQNKHQCKIDSWHFSWVFWKWVQISRAFLKPFQIRRSKKPRRMWCAWSKNSKFQKNPRYICAREWNVLCLISHRLARDSHFCLFSVTASLPLKIIIRYSTHKKAYSSLENWRLYQACTSYASTVRRIENTSK